MDELKKPVLVLGIGNILLRDEGVGVRVIEALAGEALPDDVELVDGGTAGADLVELLAHRRKVIIVDCVRAGHAAGTIVRLQPADLLPDEGENISLHQLGLVQSLRMAKQLGCLPAHVVIIAIEPEVIGPGMELSPAVAAAVPHAAQLILDEAIRDAA